MLKSKSVRARSKMYRLHILRKPKFAKVPVNNLQKEDEEVVDVEFVIVRILLIFFATCSLSFTLASLYAITNILSYTFLLGLILISIVSSLFLLRQSLYLDLVERRLPSCFITLLCQTIVSIILLFVQLNNKFVSSILQ